MINQNRILTGSSGNVWIDGKLMAQIKKIELKVTGKFEDAEFAGDYATYSVYTGWSGEGSISMQKIDSTVVKLLAEAFKNGIIPDIKIITKLTDKATGKSERTAVSNVVFTEFMLANWEAKGLIEEEMPLKFSEYEVLETI
ncbi:MAG: phage tail tube protein [Clostridium sp.]